MKFVILINIKMPTVVGIIIYISRINDWLCRFEPVDSFDSGYFDVYEHFKFHAQLSLR